MSSTSWSPTLIPHYGPDCPVAVVWRASWPDERIVRATLGHHRERPRARAIERTALILVGPALARAGFRGKPPLRRRL